MQNKPKPKKKIIKESSLRSNIFSSNAGVAPLELRTIFETLILGFILGITGFVLLGYSEGINIETQKIKQLNITEVHELKKKVGTVKVTGQGEAASAITEKNSADNFIFKRSIREEFIEDAWTTVKVEEAYSLFSFGDITVNPQNAQFIIKDEIKARTEGEDTVEGQKVKFRETTYGITENEKIIVIGEVSQNKIQSGKIFLVTNKTNKELIDSYSDSSNMQWWLFKLAALLLLTLGLTAFVLPIVMFLDLFPGFEMVVSLLIFVISAIVSFLFVFLTTLFISYWWVILVFVLLVLLLLINLRKRRLDNPISFIPKN